MNANPDLKNVLVTGGAGYVGSLLTPQLLEAGYVVTVYDIMYFGCEHLAPHPNLTIVEGDIRDTERLTQAFVGIDAVLHLACISNDVTFELDEALSRTINYECFEPMVITAKQAGVKRFIYVSSSSVYGVSDAPMVTEEHPLLPLTQYNTFKGLCEPLLFKHQSSEFTCTTIRPATVCGYGPRLRLDLSVNILTNLAVTNGKITVFGGTQMRPNLHIQDKCDLYKLLLSADAELIAGEIFNVGNENLTIAKIAEAVRTIVEEEFPDKKPIEIVTTPSDDLRSYHINSDKIFDKLGFRPSHSVDEAVRGLCRAFKDGRVPDSIEADHYYNIRTMKARVAG